MSNVSSDSFLQAMQNLLQNNSEENYANFEKEIVNTKFLSPVVIINKNADKELLRGNATKSCSSAFRTGESLEINSSYFPRSRY